MRAPPSASSYARIRQRTRAAISDAAIAAPQITAVQWALSTENHRLIADGTTAADAYPNAVKAAKRGFALLGDGLGSVL